MNEYLNGGSTEEEEEEKETENEEKKDEDELEKKEYERPDGISIKEYLSTLKEEDISSKKKRAQRKNKIAVITGGARGIGEATVRRFVEEGAKVYIFDILEDEGSKLAKELSKQNYFVNFIKVDIKNEDEIKNAYTLIINETKYNLLNSPKNPTKIKLEANIV